VSPPSRQPPAIALFDLDHTLVPFDSGMAWFRFLVGRGEARPALVDDYLARCQEYVAGRTTAGELHDFVAQTFRDLAPARLHALRRSFAAEVATEIPPAAHRLIAHHVGQGHRCCIVTATNRFVASALAQALGVGGLLATEFETDDGRFTGRLAGPVCHGGEKIARVEHWLRGQALQWETLGHSVFYSDSASDLPLLQKVREPVVVRPDARLRDHALTHGWRMADTLEHLRLAPL